MDDPPKKPRVKASTAPEGNLTPREQGEVRLLVRRLQKKRPQPDWVIWTALYRFVAQQVWHVKQAEQKENH